MGEQSQKQKIKATDYLIESLKLMVTISMLFIGGLVAYGGYIGYILNKKYFYSSIVLLLISSLLSVVNINSIINKVYSGNESAIRDNEVRIINFISIFALLLGVLFGSISVLKTRYTSTSISNFNSTVITDEKVVIGTADLPTIKIIKNNDGQIHSIEINGERR